MKLTRKAEIKIVDERLSIFLDGELKQSLRAQLLTELPRMQQHRLFWLLLDDRKCSAIAKALKIIRKYSEGKYRQRAIKRLTDLGADTIQYDANVAELIVAAYYMEKFIDDADAVMWERKVSDKNNSVDVTLTNYSRLINIEVTGIVDRKALQDYYSHKYDFKDKLEPLVCNVDDPKYSYIFSFGEQQLDDDLPKIDIQDIARFTKESASKGIGTYRYEKDGGVIELSISDLNKSKKEYIADLTMWSGEMKDDLRIISKVMEKAERQLPKDEINFVCITNMAGLDTETYMEAMYGQSQVVVRGEKHEFGYADNGISRRVADGSMNNLHGIIKADFDYFDIKRRTVIGNSRLKVEPEVYDQIA